MIHMLFAPTGCIAKKNRGTNYRVIHADLLAQMHRDEAERAKDKQGRHREASNNFHQTGAST